MDAWDVVSGFAIFRLIIPAGALFRLCGGRVETFGDLQPLAVKAGLNGVMMGNFDHAGAPSPRMTAACLRSWRETRPATPTTGQIHAPTTVRGWLEGSTPQTPIEELIDPEEERTSGIPRPSYAYQEG